MKIDKEKTFDFDSSIFLKSIARPIEPKMINPTEAKSSNLTKEELM